jgi:hypothetical protein
MKEAIYAVISDGRRRAEMIAKGFVQANQFTWEGAARKMLDVAERMTHG